MDVPASNGEVTLGDLQTELVYLRSLFERRLLDDSGKRQAITMLEEQVEFARRGIEEEILVPLYRELLLVLDHLAEDESPVSTLAHEQISHTLGLRGVEELQVERRFDPAREEAVGTVSAANGIPEGEIVRVVRRGFRLGDRILRPTLVEISSPGE